MIEINRVRGYSDCLWQSDGFVEQVTLELRPEGGEGTGRVKSTHGYGWSSKCSICDGKNMACSGNRKKTGLEHGGRLSGWGEWEWRGRRELDRRGVWFPSACLD